MNQYPKVFKNKYGKVTVYHSSRNEKWHSYKVAWRLGNRLFEERRSDEEGAHERAQEILQTLSKGQEVLSRVDKEKAAYYVTCEQMLEGRITLMELVRQYLKLEEKVLGTANIDECVTKYINSMESRGLSRAHIGPVKSRLVKFQKAMPGNLYDISVDMINEYLNKYENMRTRCNERITLHRLFTWCQTQGILPMDKDHVVSRSDIPKVKWEEPKIITPTDFEKVLWIAKHAYPETIIPLVLGAYAGLRRAEITRLSYEDIDMRQGIIALSAKITKTNRRRIIVISDTLMAWLEDFLRPTQDFDDHCYKYKVQRCVKHVGAFWPSNGLRHSYVSYRVQHDKDANAVALECGHNVEILMKHYKCLCTPESAEHWFNILPETTNFGMQVSEVTREIPVDA